MLVCFLKTEKQMPDRTTFQSGILHVIISCINLLGYLCFCHTSVLTISMSLRGR